MKSEVKHAGFVNALKIFLFVAAATLIALLLVEGFSSALIVIKPCFKPTLAERIHTRYDRELGWVNIPNLSIKNMYGPGKHFQTNAQGFRNDEDFAVAIPEGKVRIICSGDSFTLGYGVDNKNTWARQLVLLDRRLQTVNMGQGGYGLDQAYLWYMRDGIRFDHNVLLLSFVAIDFDRMTSDRFLGYGKPVLRMNDGEIAIRNVPVPRTSFLLPRLTEAATRLKWRMKGFRTVQLIRKIRQKIRPIPQTPSESEDHATRAIASRIFENLQKINSEKGSVLALVFLPMKEDLRENISGAWRDWVKQESEKKGYVYIDLVGALQTLPSEEMASIFLSDGHYSEKGNRWVATELMQKLGFLLTRENKMPDVQGLRKIDIGSDSRERSS